MDGIDRDGGRRDRHFDSAVKTHVYYLANAWIVDCPTGSNPEAEAGVGDPNLLLPGHPGRRQIVDVAHGNRDSVLDPSLLRRYEHAGSIRVARQESVTAKARYARVHPSSGAPIRKDLVPFV